MSIQNGNYYLKRSSNSVNKRQAGVWAPSTLILVSVHLTTRPSYLILIWLWLCFCSLSQPGLHVSDLGLVTYCWFPIISSVTGAEREGQIPLAWLFSLPHESQLRSILGERRSARGKHADLSLRGPHLIGLESHVQTLILDAEPCLEMFHWIQKASPNPLIRGRKLSY